MDKHAATWTQFLYVLILFFSLSIPVHAGEDLIGDLIQDQIKPEPQKSRPAPAETIVPPKKWTIVIDPGHGGKDTGAIGHRKIREKEVVLQISRRLLKALKKRLDANVILTRNGDSFVTLDERDRIAVRKNADVFLSVHANAASRRDANGIEIYYLNNATDEAAERLASRENKGSRKSLSDLKKILSTLIQTESTELSAVLASQIRKALKTKIKARYRLERLHIKTALFYVLVGSKAPSILLEVGFVTNPIEARRLSQRDYQHRLAEAVALGVEAYLNVVKSQKINL